MMITVSFHEENMNQITVLRQTTRRSVLSLAVCAIACWSGTMDPACRAAEKYGVTAGVTAEVSAGVTARGTAEGTAGGTAGVTLGR